MLRQEKGPFVPLMLRRGPGSRGVLPIAGAYAMQSLPFATSNKLTTAANAIFLQSTSPVLSAVWAWTFHGERPAPWAARVVAALASDHRTPRAAADVGRTSSRGHLLGNLPGSA